MTLINIPAKYNSDEGLLTHPLTISTTWFVDINGRWPDSGNLITGGSMDLEEVLIPF